MVDEFLLLFVLRRVLLLFGSIWVGSHLVNLEIIYENLAVKSGFECLVIG